MFTDLSNNIADPKLLLAIKALSAIILILITSSLCGRLALLVAQPRVLGEMVAGILLGPTLLGLALPDLQAALFTDEVKSVLYVLSTIGLTLFMFLVGVGMDHGGASARSLGRGGVGRPVLSSKVFRGGSPPPRRAAHDRYRHHRPRTSCGWHP